MLITIKKNKLEKSNIKARILNIEPTALTNVYPSMENDNSPYIIKLQIENIGYKEEMMKAIKCIYSSIDMETEINKMIQPKIREDLDIELQRKYIMMLRKIELSFLNDKSIYITRREIRRWKLHIEDHIQALRLKWKDGIMIREEDI